MDLIEYKKEENKNVRENFTLIERRHLPFFRYGVNFFNQIYNHLGIILQINSKNPS